MPLPPLPLPTDLIEVNAAARLLGCHVSAVYRYIHSGKLPAWRIGGKLRLSRVDVVAFPERTVKVEVVKEIRPLTQAETMQRLRAAGYLE